MFTYDGSSKASGIHVYINGKEIPVIVILMVTSLTVNTPMLLAETY